MTMAQSNSMRAEEIYSFSFFGFTVCTFSICPSWLSLSFFSNMLFLFQIVILSLSLVSPVIFFFVPSPPLSSYFLLTYSPIFTFLEPWIMSRLLPSSSSHLSSLSILLSLHPCMCDFRSVNLTKLQTFRHWTQHHSQEVTVKHYFKIVSLCVGG